MNILTDEQTRKYYALSRYETISFYYNTEDNKYIYGLTKNLSKDTPYVLHTVKSTDTLDSLSLKYYGRPDYYWIIANFNNIQDCLESLSNYKSIKIPTFTLLQYED